jgi:hypothetical protein
VVDVVDAFDTQLAFLTPSLTTNLIDFFIFLFRLIFDYALMAALAMLKKNVIIYFIKSLLKGVLLYAYYIIIL